MYEQSLEQLIDAVIADGIITDQERKVVYKKAAALGIDEDEIEVYLEGRLSAFNNNNKPKSGKHGALKTCPNCGAVVDVFTGTCKECGYNFVGIESNNTTKQLQTELERIDKENRQSVVGSMFSQFGLDKNTNRKVQLIKNFSIPNTKADLLEFAMLCYSNLSATASTNADFELRKAWSAKSKQVVAKAKLLFPNDKDVIDGINVLTRERKSFFKSHQKTITIICILAFNVIFFGSLFLWVSHSEDETQNYFIEKVQEVESLPVPNINNYQECYNDFKKIHWTKSKNDARYQAFVEAQIAYRDLLIIAYKEAGISEDKIPQSLLHIGDDLKEDKKIESEVKNDSIISLTENSD